MTTFDARRVEFLLQELTSEEVGNTLGLTPAAVEQIASGEVPVPQVLRQEVRNYYAREAYARAREAGMSPSLARSVRNLSAENMMDRVNTFSDRVLEFTEGAVADAIQALVDAGEDVTQAMIDQLYADKYTAILEGLQQSQASYDEIMSEKY